MDANAGPSRPVVDRIGIRARRSLSPGSSGQVLAGRSRVRYLLSTGGELAWLAPRGVPMHRRAVRLAAFDPSSMTDRSYRVTAGGFLVSPGIEIDLNSASTWDPPRPTPGRHAPAGLEGHAHLARELLRGLPEPQGFGALLPMILEPSPSAQRKGESTLGGPSAGVFGAAQHLAGACRQGDLRLVLSHAAELVGRGEGLTPSGDDFLGGILFALASLGWGTGDPAAAPPARVSSFLDWSRNRTTTISHALLRDYAHGEGPGPLESFAAGLLGAWPQPWLLRAARELTSVGQSTGWSLLCGVWTALVLAPARLADAPVHPSPRRVPALS